jgi:hypothetical protein
MDALNELAGILQVDRSVLEKVGHPEAFQKVYEDNLARVNRTVKNLGLIALDASAREALERRALAQDAALKAYVDTLPGGTQFDKAASLARRIARVGKGFFLKREFAERILRQRPPENLLAFFKYQNVDELLSKHDVMETMSALRFMESDEWMHQTFDAAYSSFTAADFEERDIELRVLGPEWHEVALKFVEKKHHNVSHLKEFGVIFLNPIAEDAPGKFLRDFALLFHYFHEVEFYSKMFRKYSTEPTFAEDFKMLLRGDVKGAEGLGPKDWLIVQRYFWKLDPKDARLFIPRVNPESLHWRRGEMDITHFAASVPELGLEFWEDLDWVGVGLPDKTVASLDIEDNAMAAVSLAEGKPAHLNYHQREAVWLRIFEVIVGSEEETERLIMENFKNGIITLP